MNQDTQQFVYKVTAISALVTPLCAMLLIGLYILFHDGVEASQVLNNLTAIAVGGTAIGGFTATVAHIVGGQVARAQVAQPTTPAASSSSPVVMG